LKIAWTYFVNVLAWMALHAPAALNIAKTSVGYVFKSIGQAKPEHVKYVVSVLASVFIYVRIIEPHFKLF
jgi:hypothetical protein